ncbi:hypothetical protein FV222_00370 [Methylobacterium sp. WL103]|uniref:hypothetical protein n=1 Tax=Methylobacterium sp. WL103 TaxID=2603891 RepID=UPI0011C888B0|nr:hypothetical protein [Methylobacterium sp. WL103]TXN08959.1 hypothetical protein FV222_00370 [Methylobacterium sp. WL103]
MSETATIDMIAEDDSEPFAAVTVQVVEFEHARDGLCSGFYFAIPQAEGIDPLPGEVFIHGPFNTREEALREAGAFILEAASIRAEALTKDELLDEITREVEKA